ncbi:hypothetical protein JOY44_17995 [Phormidium sp. CLA17]|uniref:hypothetical protein n=1 Tax=Leptolyngbya sp. Cla-17 TaxID=2803751 RepID=UPI001490AC77|nr:hypothetical protein [Leptolyngbya sp. Cla-17]MBM0743480.1 hypothetical protein [Leptolyngbya sp. Cla-17]
MVDGIKLLQVGELKIGRRGREIHTGAKGKRKNWAIASPVGSPVENFANVSRIAHAKSSRGGQSARPQPNPRR